MENLKKDKKSCEKLENLKKFLKKIKILKSWKKIWKNSRKVGKISRKFYFFISKLKQENAKEKLYSINFYTEKVTRGHSNMTRRKIRGKCIYWKIFEIEENSIKILKFPRFGQFFTKILNFIFNLHF